MNNTARAIGRTPGLVIALSLLAAIVGLWFYKARVAPPRGTVSTALQTGRSAVEAKPFSEVDKLIVSSSTIAKVSPETAREINARMPFSAAPNPAAAPYVYQGEVADRARAEGCLAAAQYYEAGDDAIGQQAVAQVVLNRLRHPAYPKTICGVVFQGEERKTGCQFTFTCDGALARSPQPAAWSRALQIAARMLTGLVYKPVGYATHYHTDWVVPYWSASLDKLTMVETHIFYRWAGSWGRPGAFHAGPSQAEPIISKLQHLSVAHNSAAVDEIGVAMTGQVPTAVEPKAALIPDEAIKEQVRVIASLPRAGAFLVEIGDSLEPDYLGRVAQMTCEKLTKCNLMAWRKSIHTPKGFPLSSGALSNMAYNFVKESNAASGKSYWNCALVKAPSGAACFTTQQGN